MYIPQFHLCLLKWKSFRYKKGIMANYVNDMNNHLENRPLRNFIHAFSHRRSYTFCHTYCSRRESRNCVRAVVFDTVQVHPGCAPTPPSNMTVHWLDRRKNIPLLYTIGRATVTDVLYANSTVPACIYCATKLCIVQYFKSGEKQSTFVIYWKLHSSVYCTRLLC